MSVADEITEYLDTVLVGDAETKLKACRLLEKRCSLCTGVDRPVPSMGSRSAKVLIVDTKPGYRQAEAGSHLALDVVTHRFLLRVLVEMGYTFQDCVLTYCYHCRVADRRCLAWLKYELGLYSDVEVIITLGEDPFKYFTGSEYKLSVVYGKIYDVSLGMRTVKLIPLLHPWFLIHNPDMIKSTMRIIDVWKEGRA